MKSKGKRNRKRPFLNEFKIMRFKAYFVYLVVYQNIKI